MRVIQLAPAQWLVLDEQVRPRFLIVEGPMVNKTTGETHDMHRVEWCRDELEQEAVSRARVSASAARKGF